MYFNNNDSVKYSTEQPVFVKSDGIYTIKTTGLIVEGDYLIQINADGSYTEEEVVSIHQEGGIKDVYQFSCEPYDWFIAGGYLVHNK